MCEWLFDAYPNAGPASDSAPFPDVPGYEEAAGFGCIGLAWVRLSPALCVLNLRHSPCPATIAALEQCEAYFKANYQSFVCSDAHAACAAFEGPGTQYGVPTDCDESVFQASPTVAQLPPPYGETCQMSLPIAPGATCPPTGAADGGAD